MAATTSCVPCCTTPQVTNIPGAQGSDGTNGTNGVDSFTTVDSPGFTVPNAAGSVTIPVVNSSWIAVGQYIIVEGPANFLVTAVPNATSVTGTFTNDPGNVNPSTVIAAGAKVSPSGQRCSTSLAVTTVSADYSVLATDDVILVSADNHTITLPTAVGRKGKLYVVKQTAAFTSGTVIACSGGQTIDGAATKTISAQYKTFGVVSNGSVWFILFAF